MLMKNADLNKRLEKTKIELNLLRVTKSSFMATDKNIGEKIRQIRELKKISREDLAGLAGMDVSLIQRLEEEKLIPSLGPLIKIARAMGVRLGTFLDDVVNDGPAIVRADKLKDGIRFTSQESGSREHLNFYSLAQDKAGRSMEPFIVEIEPGKQVDHMLSSHEGEEFIFVLEGQVEINYGKDVIELTTGDSVYFDSIVMHHVHSGNEKPAKILAVVYAPL